MTFTSALSCPPPVKKHGDPGVGSLPSEAAVEVLFFILRPESLFILITSFVLSFSLRFRFSGAFS